MFLFVKLMEGIANSFTLIFFRSLLQIAVCLLIVVKNQEHPLGQPSARLWLLLRGGAGAAAVVAFYFCIQHLPLPDAVTLQFTVPPFAAAFALAILGEPIELIDVAGSIVCFAGVALIAHPTWLFGDTNEADADNDPSENSPTAILIGLLGAALAGLAYVSVRPIRDRASANVMVLYFAACSIPITMLGSFWCLGNVGDVHPNRLDLCLRAHVLTRNYYWVEYWGDGTYIVVYGGCGDSENEARDILSFTW
mmetsp:Transcript_28695/g.78844  ORF Transcript_28695/g.78844 Transcript_28695/m.78844 type:complete len:251 (+) Transcript_28695:966-1718(+)